ncbi:immunity 49 family protein [Kitasatospora sp. NBC_01287]|uniref:immunity 49 family protein n=1 Tax=Kitasatospora sp. NBC_01287 TaxID=2903573 RepID=UPI00224CBCFD|nr:immunity 49 family protein [Kitasatospora sp. NBC_01287]MCX4746171.1 immunity 49 family protein [Kitasatospora sp. NBC_01287]
MREVERHEVDGRHTVQALDRISHRIRWRWYGMRYDDPSPERLKEMRDELLDHLAARTAQDPALDAAARSALLTAAECALGVLGVGCFPDGDQEILLPLVGLGLSSEDIAFGEAVEQAPTARTWLDAFEMCLVSGLLWEWPRVIGLVLRNDYAPAIRDGVPYSKLDSTSDPADRAAMDALCGYLTRKNGHLPRDRPTVTLCKPDADERAEAARQLDAVGPLTPDQLLLRVLLDDDPHAFEQALAVRLVEHRESQGPDPAPRTLLPVGALALAALAVQVHGWELGIRSGYLPPDLLGSPDALRRAAAAGPNNLGRWGAE